MVDGKFVELTRTEYQLLELLMLNPRRVLPHTLIYDRVWGYDFGPTSNALRVYVGYLRRKLEEAGARAQIHTVQGRRLRAAGARRMSLRTRMVLVAGVAVAIAVIAVAVGSYVGTRSSLQGQVDQSLQSVARPVLGRSQRSAGPVAPTPGAVGSGRVRRTRGVRPTADPDQGLGLDRPPTQPFGGPSGTFTLVTPNGTPTSPRGQSTRSR